MISLAPSIFYILSPIHPLYLPLQETGSVSILVAYWFELDEFQGSSTGYQESGMAWAANNAPKVPKVGR